MTTVLFHLPLCRKCSLPLENFQELKKNPRVLKAQEKPSLLKTYRYKIELKYEQATTILAFSCQFLALSWHNLTDFCSFFGESFEDHFPIGIMCSKFTFSQITSTWLATVSQVNTPSLDHFQTCLHFAKSSSPAYGQLLSSKFTSLDVTFPEKKLKYIQSFLPQFNCQLSTRSSPKNWRTLCQG